MKKYIIIILAAVLCMSCNKQVGESRYDDSIPVQQYMMYIADNMVTDVLYQLEDALYINSIGATSSSRFDIHEGPFTQEGVTWTVTAIDCPLKGMTMTHTGPETWEVNFDGQYPFGNRSYRTNFIMKAKRGSVICTNHYSWSFTLSGNRTERGGYACTYETLNTVVYNSNSSQTSAHTYWNVAVGSMRLVVYKYGDVIDEWRASFNGNGEPHFDRI